LHFASPVARTPRIGEDSKVIRQFINICAERERSEKLKIGIALGGGGARGFAHLGVLKALEEEHILPDVISGVSSGAIVGAFIAFGKKPDEILEIMKDCNFLDYAKVSLPVTGFFTLGNFEENIKRHLSVSNFSDLKLPLYVAVTNLYSGSVEYLDKGLLIPAIQASCSIPVLFAPVEINRQLYVDGGLVDNLPYKPLVDKCDKIIAVNIFTHKKTDRIRNLIEVAVRTFELSIGIDTGILQNKCDLLIEPTGLENFNILDSSRAEELYRIGYEYCKNNENIRKFIG